MKKKTLIFLICTVLVFVACSAFMAGCADGDEVAYSVTLLDPDEMPLEGITVTWQQASKTKGSAVTDENGKASVRLAPSTYTVLLGVDAGWEPNELSVGSSMREPVVVLSRKQLNYQATVYDKDGLPATGVTVSWVKGTTVAGSGVTDTSGTAKCKLDYDEYTVTVGNLPEGNVFAGTAPTTAADSASVTINLTEGDTTNYSATVRSEGGLLFKSFTVVVYKDGLITSSGVTDSNGVWSANLADGDYTIRALSLDDGYTETPLSLSASVASGELILKSQVIKSAPSQSTRYYVGSIIHDYTFTTPYEVNGKPISVTISELLKDKDAVFINNWGRNCSFCMNEMPAMHEAYLKYRDDIELIALNNYTGLPDSEDYIRSLYGSSGYEFPMVRDTSANFTTKFAIDGWPTTIVIDRYGAIARIEEGAIQDSETWGELIEKYIGPDYTQSFTPGADRSDSIVTEIAKPDIVLPDDHFDNMAAILNDTDGFPSGASVEYDADTSYEYSWPYVFGTVEGVSDTEEVVYAGGTGKANSMSVLYAYVTVQAGKVFTFDYYSDTEADADVMTVIWDGKTVKEISGNSKGWQTCKLYADLAPGTHTAIFVYIKDQSLNQGKDNVYIRRVRFTDLDDITEPTDMPRGAAYGTPEENATQFPHYATVFKGDDGYYRVDVSELENSEYAGNDDSPMLFASMLVATNWWENSVRDIVYAVNEAGDYAFDFSEEFRDAIVPYISAATNSDIYGYIPVDEDVRAMLETLIATVKGSDPYENEWLELCYFYSHYGSGDPIGNPILGLTEKTAIEANLGRNTAVLTRIMSPFPCTIYTFMPTESGVYRFHSLIDYADDASQIWLYDDETDAGNPLAYCGDDFTTRTGEDENNFDLYAYLTAGHRYYIALAFQMNVSGTYDYEISLAGDSKEVLTAASAQYYFQDLDENGNWDGYSVNLAEAVAYEIDDDGYYRAVRVGADGEPELGSYIYLDVKYATGVGNGTSLAAMAAAYVRDPKTFANLTYKTFDFTKCINYVYAYDNEGYEIINYDPYYDLTVSNPETGEVKFKDYTDRVLEIIDSAPASGEEEGLVKVTQEIVDILTLYFEYRNNTMYDGMYEPALENEWLRFCRYVRLYNEQNP